MATSIHGNQHNPILKAMLKQVSNELLLNDQITDANPNFPFPSILLENSTLNFKEYS